MNINQENNLMGIKQIIPTKPKKMKNLPNLMQTVIKAFLKDDVIYIISVKHRKEVYK